MNPFDKEYRTFVAARSVQMGSLVKATSADTVDLWDPTHGEPIGVVEATTVDAAGKQTVLVRIGGVLEEAALSPHPLLKTERAHEVLDLRRSIEAIGDHAIERLAKRGLDHTFEFRNKGGWHLSVKGSRCELDSGTWEDIHFLGDARRKYSALDGYCSLVAKCAMRILGGDLNEAADGVYSAILAGLFDRNVAAQVVENQSFRERALLVEMMTFAGKLSHRYLPPPQRPPEISVVISGVVQEICARYDAMMIPIDVAGAIKEADGNFADLEDML